MAISIFRRCTMAFVVAKQWWPLGSTITAEFVQTKGRYWFVVPGAAIGDEMVMDGYPMPTFANVWRAIFGQQSHPNGSSLESFTSQHRRNLANYCQIHSPRPIGFCVTLLGGRWERSKKIVTMISICCRHCLPWILPRRQPPSIRFPRIGPFHR